MNKLLLLVISLINIVMKSFAADVPQQDSATQPQAPLTDSTIKQEVLNDPKEGFKDLFESTTTAGFSAQKLNPLAISFMEDYVAREKKNMEKLKGWGKPYFDMMDEVLAKHGLPIELKYLSVIESSLKANAVSWAGAVGPWQFMPETARLMGLKVNKSKDERRDYVKSTRAAAKYLTQLYALYNDWLLVIAAYNGGPGKVNTAIRKSGSRNFWELQKYLPAESRNHVKKFIATHYYMEGEGGLTTMTRNERETALLNTASYTATSDLSVTPVSGKYQALVIAQSLNMSMAEFNRLNPNFDKQISVGGTYSLRLPADKATLFQASKPQILEQSIQLMLTTAGR